MKTKKISNLLVMGLLAFGMGLTSCDEQLDNAITPGVTANEATVKVGGKEVDIKSFDDISDLLADDEVAALLAASTEKDPFVIEISSDAALSTAGGDNAIELPFVNGAFVELNFEDPVSTSADKPLKIVAPAGDAATDANKLTITMPDAESAYLVVEMPSTTVTLQSPDGVTYKKVVSTTATSTIVIGKGVIVEELIIAKGRYRLDGGEVKNVIYLYSPIVFEGVSDNGLQLKVGGMETMPFSINNLYAESDDEKAALEFEIASSDEKVVTVKKDAEEDKVIITAVAAGEAEITVSVKGDEYAKATLKVSVEKLTPTVTAPTVKTGLTYNKSAQALVTAGTVTGGTMQYSLNGTSWSEDVPTATNAGDYTVQYKVVGDASYSDLAAQSLTVTIAKANLTCSVPRIQEFGGVNSSFIEDPGYVEDGTIEWRVETGEGEVVVDWTQDPKIPQSGTYKVYYRFVPNDVNNYNYNSEGSWLDYITIR